MQGQAPLRPRGERVRKSSAVAAGNAHIAFGQRPLGMGELGHLPRGAQPFGEPRDALVDEVAPQPARDEVQVGAGIAGACGE